MCGRFTITKDLKLVEGFFDALMDSDVCNSINASPTQSLPVILDVEPKRIQLVRWGLVPSWAKDAAIGSRMINARAETITEKPSFRGLIRRRRCLVVADGFYEWKTEAGGKQPHRILLKSGEPFGMAGLWDEWRNPEGRLLRTFTIITTEANAFMKPIHHRMPVILPHGEEGRWLDPKAPVDAVLSMLRPCDSDLLVAETVPRVGR